MPIPKYRVRFIKIASPYQAGEVASFCRADARALVRKGLAVAVDDLAGPGIDVMRKHHEAQAETQAIIPALAQRNAPHVPRPGPLAQADRPR
jgi:hypothetical protein